MGATSGWQLPGGGGTRNLLPKYLDTFKVATFSKTCNGFQNHFDASTLQQMGFSCIFFVSTLFRGFPQLSVGVFVFWDYVIPEHLRVYLIGKFVLSVTFRNSICILDSYFPCKTFGRRQPHPHFVPYRTMGGLLRSKQKSLIGHQHKPN